MRRKPKLIADANGVEMDARFEWFHAHEWPGETDWDKYQVWRDARQSWAKANHPDGYLPIPLSMPTPDEPFDPYGSDGERSFGLAYPGGMKPVDPF